MEYCNPSFEGVLKEIHMKLYEVGALDKEIVMMNYSDKDGKLLNYEARFKNIDLPSYLKSAINFIVCFPNLDHHRQFRQQTIN